LLFEVVLGQNPPNLFGLLYLLPGFSVSNFFVLANVGLVQHQHPAVGSTGCGCWV